MVGGFFSLQVGGQIGTGAGSSGFTTVILPLLNILSLSWGTQQP
jgi:hypothetical protein